MDFDVLTSARGPLHVNDILERIRAQVGVEINRDSLVISPKQLLRIQIDGQSLVQAAA